MEVVALILNLNKKELIVYFSWTKECEEFALKIIKQLELDGYSKICNLIAYQKKRAEKIGDMHPAILLAIEMKCLMNENSLGIIISASGIGSNALAGLHNNEAVPILANNEEITIKARKQHNTRIIAIGSENRSFEATMSIVRSFLTTEFESNDTNKKKKLKLRALMTSKEMFAENPPTLE